MTLRTVGSRLTVACLQELEPRNLRFLCQVELFHVSDIAHVSQSSPSISIPRARRIVRASSSHSAAIASYSFESRSLKFTRVSAACYRSPSEPLSLIYIAFISQLVS